MKTNMYSIEDMAKIFGIARPTIRKLLRKAGYMPSRATGHGPYKFCDEKQVEAVARTCEALPYCPTQTCRFCVYEKCVILTDVPHICKFYKAKEVVV